MRRPNPMTDPLWAAYLQGVRDGLSHAPRLGPAVPGGNLSWRAHSQLPGDRRYVQVVVEAVETPAGNLTWAARVEQPLALWRVKFAGGSRLIYAADEATARAASDLSPDAGVWVYPAEVVSLAVALSAETVDWLETIAAQNQTGIRELHELVQHILYSLTDGARRPGSWERGVLRLLVGEPPSGWGQPNRRGEFRQNRRPLTPEGLSPRDWTRAVADTITLFGDLGAVPSLCIPEGDDPMHWLLAFLHAAARGDDPLTAAGWLVLLFEDLGAVDCELVTDEWDDVHGAALVASRTATGPIAGALKWWIGREREDAEIDELRRMRRVLFDALAEDEDHQDEGDR